MTDQNPGPPEYKVYRSRRHPLTKGGDLDALRRRLSRVTGREPELDKPRKPITPGRVVKWVALAIAGWLLLSLVLFLVSAQIQDGISDDAKAALSKGGSMLGGTNILVLGSDARTGESIDESSSGPSRADTIMIVHAELGGVRKLSIPRDTEAEIPGHGSRKINAAYALGGPALTIETVENFLGNGLKINHLVEVDFKDFPAFIDALGGITVNNKTKICAPPFDNFWKGIQFRKGELHLDGTRALGYARVRKNNCNLKEDDRARAARQQEVMRAIGAQAKSPGTFFRLPWVSWQAPKALKTDMRGLALMGLFADVATGNSDETDVLDGTCCDLEGDIQVSPGTRAEAVDRLLNGD